MLSAFWLHFGFILAPFSTLGRPRGPPGSDPAFCQDVESILAPIWGPFRLHFGSLLAPISVSFFNVFSGSLLERLRGVLGRIWVPFGFHFGSILDAFSETL